MNKNHPHNEEISVKDLILKLREYFEEIKAAKKWLLFSAFLFMVLLGIKALNDKADYKAELTFMINEDTGNPLGSLSGVLGTFGITAKSKNNLARVLELSRSRKIVENALFNTVKINDNDDFLSNHLINYYDSLGRWNSKPWFNPFVATDDSLETFRFDHHGLLTFGATGNKALKILYHKIAGNPEKKHEGFLENGYDEESRIMYLSVKLKNENLAITLCNTLFDELSDFYIEKSTEKQKATFEIIKSKTDSLQSVQHEKQKKLAQLEDSWKGRYSNKSKLQQDRLAKEIMMLNIALGESIKNKEIADFAVKNTTPFVQIIDRPLSPIQGYKNSLFKNLFLGFFLGIFVMAIWIMAKKLLRDAMA